MKERYLLRIDPSGSVQKMEIPPGGPEFGVSVLCDGCGLQVGIKLEILDLPRIVSHYKTIRAEVKKQGWIKNERGDFCPNCQAGKE